jgi:hypothetical protein
VVAKGLMNYSCLLRPELHNAKHSNIFKPVDHWLQCSLSCWHLTSWNHTVENSNSFRIVINILAYFKIRDDGWREAQGYVYSLRINKDKMISWNYILILCHWTRMKDNEQWVLGWKILIRWSEKRQGIAGSGNGEFGVAVSVLMGWGGAWTLRNRVRVEGGLQVTRASSVILKSLHLDIIRLTKQNTTGFQAEAQCSLEGSLRLECRKELGRGCS